MSESSGSPAVYPELVARYEQLRREAIQPPAHCGEGLGLALFLRCGMTVWMQAWSECATHVEPGTHSQASVDQVMAADMRSQITTLLAGMILCLQLEATS